MSEAHEVLREVRQALGVSPAEVARRIGLDAGVLEAVEAGTKPLETDVLDELAELYGVPAADVACGEPVSSVLEPVRVLLKSSADLGAAARLDISRIAAAMRDLRTLEGELDEPDRYANLRSSFLHEGEYGEPGGEWRRGRDLAEYLRDHLGLGREKPIDSMRDLVTGLGIELVAVDLADNRIAGFSLADEVHGPTIVVNMAGANANPWVRRFTIAHELCHVLHDERVHEDVLPSVQLYDQQDGEPRAGNSHESDARVGPEPRANGFAASLLAPDDGVRALLIGSEDAETWRARESLDRYEWFPARSVPNERRGRLAALTIKALHRDLVDRRQALTLLRASPDEDLEDLTEFVGEG